MHTRRLVKAILAGALIALITAPTALAASPTATQGTAPLMPTGTSAGVTPMASNPWGCISRSDLPHMSTHVPGTVDAQGNTICQTIMPAISVSAALSRQDCFFLVCWWTQVDQKQLSGTFRMSIYVNPAYTCVGSTPTHRFRIDTYSQATGPDGIIYAASTYNESGALPCGGG